MQEGMEPAETGALTRRLASGAAWAQVARLTEIASSLVLSLLLIRALGPAHYGEYSFLVNVAAFGAALLSLGFPDTVMRFVSVLLARRELDQIRFLLRRIVLLRVVVYLVGIGLLYLFKDAAASLHIGLAGRYWAAIALLLVSQGAIEFTTSYAYARLRARDVAVARTVGQVLAVAFFAAVVLLGLTDVLTAVFTVAISYLAAAVILFGQGLIGVLVRGESKPLSLRPVAGFALGAWAITLGAGGLAGQVDVVLLGALRRDAVQIALYSVATLVFVKLGTFLGGWAGTATSSFADIHTRRGVETTRRLLGVYLRFQVLLSLVVYPPVILVSGLITNVVFGAGYGGAASLMRVYGALWLVSALMAAGIPLSLLLALGYQRQAFWIRAGTGLLNVVLDVVLIPPLGALGAILATGFANALAHLLDLAVVGARVGSAFPWVFAGRLLVASGVAYGAAFFVAGQGLLGELAAAVLYGLVFVGLLYLLRPVTAEDVELITRLSPRAAAVVQRLAGR
jgi:O-antigen/teichoic acid export membrane protein